MPKDIPLILPSNVDDSINYSYDPHDPLIEDHRVLVQRIVKKILTLRGSNGYDPDIGTSFLNLFGTVDLDAVDSVKESVPVLVKSLRDQIIQEQIDYELEGNTIPKAQKLKDLTIDNFEFDEILGGWLFELNVITENSEFTITVP